MASKRKRLFLAALGLALVGAIAARNAQQSQVDAPAAATRERTPPRIGERLTYAVHYEGDVELPSPTGQDDGTFAVASTFTGDVSLTFRGEHEGLWHFDWTIDSASEHTVSLGGSDASVPRAAADTTSLQRTATLVFRPDGTLVEIDFDPDAPEPFVNLTRVLAVELQLVRSPETEWTSTEPAQQGRARVQYRRSRNDSRITRARDRYESLIAFDGQFGLDEMHQDLVSETTFELGEDDRVLGLTSSEELEVTGPDGALMFAFGSTLSFELLRVDVALDRGRMRTARRIDPSSPGVDASALRAALVAQADGLTWSDVEHELKRVDNQEFGGEHAELVWRLAGLLELNPELSWALAPLFHDAEVSDTGRASIINVLAGVTHPVGQTAMLELLRSETAREATNRLALVQLASHATQPQPGTVDYAFELLESEVDPKLRAAGGVVAGALVRTMDAGGDTTLADAAYERLHSALLTAETVELRAELLRGLGNTRRDTNAAIAATFSSDPSPVVRQAAAQSLWYVHTEGASAVLGDMTRDENRHVQRAALTGIRLAPSGSRDYGDLARAITDGSLSSVNGRPALRILQQMPEGPMRDGALAALAEAARNDPGLRAAALAAMG